MRTQSEPVRRRALSYTDPNRGFIHMNQLKRSLEIIATYRKHGWQLLRVLMTSEARAEAGKRAGGLFESVRIDDALIDALWFSRTSHKNREAWELRLVTDAPYALFETFAAD